MSKIKTRVALVMSFLLLLLVLPGQAASVSSYEKQIREQKLALKTLEGELKSQREQVENLQSEESGVLNTISLLDRNLRTSTQYVNGLGKTEKLLDSSATHLESQVDSLGVSLKQQQRVMAKRIQRLYMDGDDGRFRLFRVLLNMKGDALRYAFYVRTLLHQDQEMVSRFSATKDTLGSRYQKLQVRLDELREIRTKKSKEVAQLASRKNEQNDYLSSLQQSRSLQEKALKEFEANQKMLAKLIQNLEEKRKKELAAAKKTEKPKKTVKIAAINKCWPLRGKVLSAYGRQRHAVLKTVTRNLGVEFQGKKSSKVKSAAAGTVAMVTPIQGHGQGIIIDHGNSFYTVYGNMENIRVKEGEEVRRCQELGSPGDEESMNGVKLYFQVSEGVHTIDPIEWLEDAK